MRYIRRIKTVKCKGCGKPITTMIDPFLATKEMQEKYARYCSECMPEDLAEGLREDYRNLMLDKIRQDWKQWK